MSRRTILLVAVVLGASSCTSGYRVHVNGYSEWSESIAPNAALFVSLDPNAPNPIFARQVKADAETLLRGYGYRVADTPATADYRLHFQVGMKSETVMGYTPAFRPHAGARGGYRDEFFFGYSTYTPYFDTVYDPWLLLRLFEAGGDDDDPNDLVWVGEATLNTDRADLRQTVGYLLIGGIEYLGVDTGQKVTVPIKKDDPRLVDIADR